MKPLLSLLICLQAADAVFTRWAVTEGLTQEWNPFVAHLVGDWRFLLIKLAGALVSAVVLWGIYLRFPKAALLGTGSVVVFYGLILAWNSGIIIVS
jgi:hypothetical protein